MTKTPKKSIIVLIWLIKKKREGGFIIHITRAISLFTKKTYIVFLCIGLLLSSSLQAKNLNGNINVNIVDPTDTAITLFENEALDFAVILPTLTGPETVTVTTTGTISTDNGAILSGTPSAANFLAFGGKNAAVTASLSSGDILTGPGPSLSLHTLNTDLKNNPKFDKDGELIFNVGGSLTLNGGQLGGVYTGTYTVTLDYN